MSPEPLTGAELADLEAGMARCLTLARPLATIVYRCSTVERANKLDFLSGVGAKLHGGRWNPLDIRTAYTSLDWHTAFEESVAAKVSNGLPIWAALPLVIASAEVSLDRVLDLTAPEVIQILDPLGFTLARMLADPWRTRIESRGAQRGITIEIGRIAYGASTQGLIVPSKPQPTGKNLAIFPDHCDLNSLAIINVGRLPR